MMTTPAANSAQGLAPHCALVIWFQTWLQSTGVGGGAVGFDATGTTLLVLAGAPVQTRFVVSQHVPGGQTFEHGQQD